LHRHGDVTEQAEESRNTVVTNKATNNSSNGAGLFMIITYALENVVVTKFCLSSDHMGTPYR